MDVRELNRSLTNHLLISTFLLLFNTEATVGHTKIRMNYGRVVNCNDIMLNEKQLPLPVLSY